MNLEIREIKAQIAALREDYHKAAGDVFASQSRELFTRYPELEQFSWDQYTPYFNDSDPCEFSAHTYEDSVRINGVCYEELYKWRISAKAIPDIYGGYHRYTDYEKVPTEHSHLEPLFEPVATFLQQFDYDALEALFGDHTTVTVTRNGIQRDACEDHD